jgi:hypothetical protein
MNDVIQAVGPHKDKHGERCEVKHIDQGIAFGFDSDGDPSWWKCDTGNWQGAGDDYRLHIVGPWIEPKPEWRPTNHYHEVTRVNGFEWTTQWQGRPPMTRRIEQKWTRGTEEEWRPVTTTTEGT